MIRRAFLLAILVLTAACKDKEPSTAALGSAATTSSAAPSATSAAVVASAAPTVQAPPSDVATALPSANLTMQGVTLNGFKMKDISCVAPGANPLTGMTKLNPIAKQQVALDACVDTTTEVSIQVTVADKKATDVRVAGAPTPAAAACIAKALKEAPWTDSLTCVVKFDLKAAK